MKTVKRATACLLAVLLCLSLCSCNALDEMRKHHAIIREDGTILWNNAEYRPLPIQDEMVWEKYPLFFNDDVDSLYLTDASVPVLLSEQYGDYCISYNEDTILCVGYSEYTENSYYCLSSQYGKITKELERLQKQVDTTTFYYYQYYDCIGGMQTEDCLYYDLTEEETACVDKVLSKVVPIIPEEPIAIFWNLELLAGNRYHEYVKPVGMLNLATDFNYYISDVGKDGEKGYIYKVPEDLNEYFDSIFYPIWYEYGSDLSDFPRELPIAPGDGEEGSV